MKMERPIRYRRELGIIKSIKPNNKQIYVVSDGKKHIIFIPIQDIAAMFPNPSIEWQETIFLLDINSKAKWKDEDISFYTKNAKDGDGDAFYEAVYKSKTKKLPSQIPIQFNVSMEPALPTINAITNAPEVIPTPQIIPDRRQSDTTYTEEEIFSVYGTPPDEVFVKKESIQPEMYTPPIQPPHPSDTEVIDVPARQIQISRELGNILNKIIVDQQANTIAVQKIFKTILMLTGYVRELATALTENKPREEYPSLPNIEFDE